MSSRAGFLLFEYFERSEFVFLMKLELNKKTKSKFPQLKILKKSEEGRMKNWIARNFQKAVFWPIYFILRTFFGFKIEGQEKIKNIKGGVIFVANHASILDGAITATAIATPWNGFSMGEFLPIRYLAYANYFSWFNVSGKIRFPLSILSAGWMRLSACIPVKPRKKNLPVPKTDREHQIALADILEAPIEALKNQEKIFIFPEGNMTPDGKLQQGKRGVACLHKETGVPIVPMGLEETYQMFSWENLKKFFWREKRIIVRFGEPIKLFNPNPDLSLEDGADMVMDEISKLLSEKGGIL